MLHMEKYQDAIESSYKPHTLLDFKVLLENAALPFTIKVSLN